MVRFSSHLKPSPNPNPNVATNPHHRQCCRPSPSSVAAAASPADTLPSSSDLEAAQPLKPSPFALSDPQSDDDGDDSMPASEAEEEEVEMESLWSGKDWEAAWPRKWRSGVAAGGGVTLEGYVEATPLAAAGDAGSDDGSSSSVGRTKSLTDDDLEELKGCLDLGFGFSYDEIPVLCNTLPALELCYSMSRSLELSGDGSGSSGDGSGAAAERCLEPAPAPPIANWKIASPGDHPEEVKARLKYWAQAVACTVRLCS